jgi:hypothetical protein
LISAPLSAAAQCSTAAWSSTTGSAQPLANPAGKKYEGQCGLTVDAAAAPGYVTTTAPSSEELMTARFYVYPGQLTITSGDTTIFRARDGSKSQVELRIRRGGGDQLLLAAYARSGSSLTALGTTPMQGLVWQAVSVNWTAGSGNGSVAVKLDGVQEISAGNLSNASERVNEVDLGVVNDPAASGTLTFDAFEARRTQDEPVLLATNELFNISTRTDVGTGAFAAVAGFIIQGDTPKCVVARSRGQSVNVPVTRLEDPTLELKSGSTVIDSNDNWQDHPTAAIVQSLGTQPADPLDAALYKCLDPGPYTLFLRGAAATTLGVGIVEVIDVDQGTPFLFNISTRAQVKTGVRRVVAGFIIEGDQAKQVLIRGRGPTVNINKPKLADPLIELKSGATIVETNDNWGEAANAAEISATGAAPADPNESAILRTLQPGAYTVFLQGASGETGVGIIEVIDQSGGSISLN